MTDILKYDRFYDLIYLSIDEYKTISELQRLKEAAGKYYGHPNKQGVRPLIGLHWILNKVMVEKLKLDAK